MDSKIKKDSIVSVISKVVLLIGGFASSIITARFLGPEGKGLFELYLVAPMIVMSFGELGIRQASAHFIGQKTFKSEHIHSSLMALFIISAIVSTIIVLMIYWQTNLLNDGYLIPLLFLVYTSIALLERYLNGILIGNVQIVSLNLIRIVNITVKVILFIIFIWILKMGVVGAGIGILLAQLVALILILYNIPQKHSLIPKWIKPIPYELLKKGTIYALSVFLLMMIYRIDVFMLGYLDTKYSVGIYSVGVRIGELLKQIPLSIGIVIFAHSTNWKGQELIIDKVQKLIFTSKIMFWMVAFAAVILIVLSYFFIPVLYGKEYNDSYVVFLFLSIGILLLTPIMVLNLFTTGQGKPEIVIYTIGPTVFVNIVLNYYLIPLYSFNGAAIASTISYIIATFFYLRYFNNLYNVKGLLSYFVLNRRDIKFIKTSFKLGRDN